MQINFLDTLQIGKTKGPVIEFKLQEAESIIFNSNYYSQYTFLQLRNMGVENKRNIFAFLPLNSAFVQHFLFT